jgi:hypothetical protein
MEASKDMGADEETFNVPVPLGQKVGTTQIPNPFLGSSDTNHESLLWNNTYVH